MKVIFILGILTLLAMGCTSSPTPTAMPVPTPITESARLEQFVKRLLSPSTMGPGVPTIAEPQILLGELPPDFDVPVPEGADVLGSLVQSDRSFQAILDLPMDQGESGEFYVAALHDAGWSERSRGSRGGFTSAGNVPFAFCSGDNTMLTLTLSESPIEGLTEVRFFTFNVKGMGRSPCDQSRKGGARLDMISPTGFKLPTLRSPAGVRETGSSSGSSHNSVRSEVSLITDMSAVDLEEHYRRQLLELGWELAEQAAAGPLAVSTWRFANTEGQEHSGLLWALEGPEENNRTAVIQVSLPNR